MFANMCKDDVSSLLRDGGETVITLALSVLDELCIQRNLAFPGPLLIAISYATKPNVP
jgi:hypothetical protein